MLIISLMTVWAAGHISLNFQKDIRQFLLASDCWLDSMLSRDYNKPMAPSLNWIEQLTSNQQVGGSSPPGVAI